LKSKEYKVKKYELTSRYKLRTDYSHYLNALISIPILRLLLQSFILKVWIFQVEVMCAYLCRLFMLEESLITTYFLEPYPTFKVVWGAKPETEEAAARMAVTARLNLTMIFL